MEKWQIAFHISMFFWWLVFQYVAMMHDNYWSFEGSLEGSNWRWYDSYCFWFAFACGILYMGIFTYIGV